MEGTRNLPGDGKVNGGDRGHPPGELSARDEPGKKETKNLNRTLFILFPSTLSNVDSVQRKRVLCLSLDHSFHIETSSYVH